MSDSKLYYPYFQMKSSFSHQQKIKTEHSRSIKVNENGDELLHLLIIDEIYQSFSDMVFNFLMEISFQMLN